MRIALLGFLLLLAGCTAPVPEPALSRPAAWEDRLLLDAGFAAQPGVEGGVNLTVPAGAEDVRLRIVLEDGAASYLRFSGLGGCDGYEPIRGGLSVWTNAQQTHEKECGSVVAGPQRLGWESDGTFEGRLVVTARIPRNSS